MSGLIILPYKSTINDLQEYLVKNNDIIEDTAFLNDTLMIKFKDGKQKMIKCKNIASVISFIEGYILAYKERS